MTSKFLSEDDVRDIAIRITDKLVELGYVKDCTNTDLYDEFEVQDTIVEIIHQNYIQ
jgi:hypothetical protein